jgi:CBS domain-containing protein
MNSKSNLIIEDVVAFLAKTPPFNSLDEAELRMVAGKLSVEFYPKNLVILKQGDSPSDSLRIIKKGGVRISVVSPQESGEIVMDYRDEGDSFGFLSLVGGDPVRANFTAVDDTICYLLGKDAFIGLIEAHPIFTEYFLKSHIARYINKSFRELQEKDAFQSGSDRILFTTRAQDLAIRDVVTTPEDTTIQNTAKIMSSRRISSILITGLDNTTAGIVTDRDLRTKVVAAGRSVLESVRNIMTPSLITVDAGDYCFEIVLKMIKHNIHHIVVMKDGAVAGVVTNHDLMILQGTSPLSLTKEIENQQSLDTLVPVSKRINGIVGLMLKEGARASNIIRVITEINDRLVRKALELAEKRFGTPPVAYCWIVYGSEGRKEQMFKTDQDNAIIYDDPADEAEAEACREYFTLFSEFMHHTLIGLGFPACPANNMASNPQWRQPLRVWKRYFSSWIDKPSPEAVLNSVTFFDFRPLHGDNFLAVALRDHLNRLLKDNKVFLGHMANLAVHNTPPIGFFNAFLVEKSGEHKNRFNLKVKGLAPLTDMVRLFALEKGISRTTTLGRIEALRGVHSIVAEYGDDLEHAFEIIMLLRINHQYAQITSGQEPDNYIDPAQLSNLDKKSVKEAFHLVTKMHRMITELYKALIW